jgi:short-subunit dehydrogenase
MADYCASKAALISLHDCLRQELDFRYNAPRIRTTLLAPGFVQTPMLIGQKPLKENPKIPAALFEFLMPVVSPHDIVEEIIHALDSQESREIAVPQITKTAVLRPVAPYWAVYCALWLLGSNYLMDGFRKTTGKRADEVEHRTKDD